MRQFDYLCVLSVGDGVKRWHRRIIRSRLGLERNTGEGREDTEICVTNN
jgi:hypothetical protein